MKFDQEEQTQVLCPLCNDDKSALLKFRSKDKSIYQCRCGMKFVVSSTGESGRSNKKDPQHDDAFYSQILKVLEKKKSLIYSKLTAKLRKSGKKILNVSSYATPFPDFAVKNNWEASEVQLNEKEEIDSSLENDSYDYVTLFHELDHVEHPVQLLEKCFNLLKQGGYLAVQVSNNNNLFRDVQEWMYKLLNGRVSAKLEKIYDPVQFYYFTPNTLFTMLQFFDFEIDQIFYNARNLVNQNIFEKILNFFIQYFRLSDSIIVIVRKKVNVGY